MSDDIDTFNKFGVSLAGVGGIALLNAPRSGQIISKADALNLAAYLVTMAMDEELWTETLEAVQSV